MPSLRPRLAWRGVAMFATALLLFLMVAGVRPDLHERICHHHEETGAASAAACVIFSFADSLLVSGVTGGLPALALALVAVLATGPAAVRRVAPARLNPPSCGPPRAA